MNARLPPAISGVVLIAAIVQLGPLIAALHPASLGELYGILPGDDTTILLLRHRAVLLGTVGAALLAGLWWRHLLPAAIAVALTSKVSFLLIYLATPQPTGAATRVAQVDVFTATLLLSATVALLRTPTRWRLT